MLAGCSSTWKVLTIKRYQKTEHAQIILQESNDAHQSTINEMIRIIISVAIIYDMIMAFVM